MSLILYGYSVEENTLKYGELENVDHWEQKPNGWKFYYVYNGRYYRRETFSGTNRLARAYRTLWNVQYVYKVNDLEKEVLDLTSVYVHLYRRDDDFVRARIEEALKWYTQVRIS